MNLPQNEFLTAVKFVLTSTFFTFNNSVYIQTNIQANIRHTNRVSFISYYCWYCHARFRDPYIEQI